MFAAGCFCLLSDDFACIILEILVGMIPSSQASSDVTLAAVRAFSKMRCSSSIASRAYKAGKKLVMDSLQEEFKAEMLSSLSKLASKLALLFTEQVELLLSCISGDPSSLVKSRALKCLYFLFSGGARHSPVNRNELDKLFHIIDDNDLPLNFHCEALRILRKMFCSMLPDLPYMDMPDLFKLVRIVEKAAQSSVKAKIYLALHLLVDILFSLKRGRGGQQYSSCDKWHATCLQFHGSPQAVALASGGDGPALLVCRVTSLIIDHIASLLKQMFVGCGGELMLMGNLISSGGHSKVKQECKSLLSLVLHLVEEYPSSGFIALDRIRYLIQTLVSMHENHSNETAGTGGLFQMEVVAEKLNTVFRHPESNNKQQINSVSELILWICRFANACLNTLDETIEANSEVYQRVKLLVECIQQSGSCDCDMYEIFCLRMRSYIACHCCGITNNSAENLNQSKVDVKLGLFHNVCWVGQEWRTLEFTKKMLRKRNNWAAYRAGKYSCCEGLWFAATFTFRKLVDAVQSDSCRCWLRSLMLLSGAESEIKLLLFPEVGIELINGLQTENNSGKPFSYAGGDMGQCLDIDANMHDYEGKLARVYSRICSSEEILAAAGASDGVYYFQRWFLCVRAKVFEILVDMLDLLSSHAFTEENLNKGVEGSANIHSTAVAQNVHSLVTSFASISVRLNKLAKEYDLLATSFLDIDCVSFRNISRLALNCSLLSFCTTFALYFSNTPAYENGISCSLGISGKSSRAVVVQDLVERLPDLDDKFITELQQFMTASGEVIDNLHSRTQINSAGHIERASLMVCKFAISGVLHMQEEAKGIKDEELCEHITRRLQLLSDIIRKWMGIPFKTPKYFFRIRPCVGAELFIFDADSRNRHEISISPGFQLSLNLCIQLKNASTHVRVAKIYCILAARPSDSLSIGGERDRHMRSGFRARCTDEMVELAEMLLMYIRTGTKKASSRMHVKAGNGGDLVTACVYFEPNEKGQGFSACLLDVSALPEGSYPIKWHSCCIDDSGSLWSLLPLNTGSIFTIKKP